MICYDFIIKCYTKHIYETMMSQLFTQTKILQRNQKLKQRNGIIDENNNF